MLKFHVNSPCRSATAQCKHVESPVRPASKPVFAAVKACAGMLLCGCTTLAPFYVRPALPVATRYPLTATAPALPADAALPSWRGYFSAEPLQETIALALDNNRDLRIAALRVEQARAAYGIAQATRLPSLAAQWSRQRQRVPADQSATGKGMIGRQDQASIDLGTWELDFWGRLRSAGDAALEAYLATDAARRAVTVGLIAQVAEAYFALREMDQRIALAQRTLATRQESYRILTHRTALGATSRFNLAQVETLLLQARALVAQLEQERDFKRHALQALVGVPVSLPAGLPDARLERLPALEAGLPSTLLERRADLLAAEHELKAAHADVGAARAALFPKITLTGSYGTASSQLDSLFAGASRVWTFLPGMTLQLFDGGRRRLNLGVAQARRDSAVANYEKTVQAAFREVADALSAHTWLNAQIAIAERTLEVQHDRARLAQMRYDSGATPFLDVLDAQRDLLGAEQLVLQLQRALLSAGVALYTALGGDPMGAGSGAQHLPDSAMLTPRS